MIAVDVMFIALAINFMRVTNNIIRDQEASHVAVVHEPVRAVWAAPEGFAIEREGAKR